MTAAYENAPNVLQCFFGNAFSGRTDRIDAHFLQSFLRDSEIVLFRHSVGTSAGYKKNRFVLLNLLGEKVFDPDFREIEKPWFLSLRQVSRCFAA